MDCYHAYYPFLYLKVGEYRNYEDAIRAAMRGPDEATAMMARSLRKASVDARLHADKEHEVLLSALKREPNTSPLLLESLNWLHKQNQESAQSKANNIDKSFLNALHLWFEKSAKERADDFKREQRRLLTDTSIVILVLFSIAGLLLFLFSTENGEKSN